MAIVYELLCKNFWPELFIQYTKEVFCDKTFATSILKVINVWDKFTLSNVPFYENMVIYH